MRGSLQDYDLQFFEPGYEWYARFMPLSVRHTLDQVGDVHWHLLDLSRVELLNITHHSDILSGNKVDCNTNVSTSLRRTVPLATETTTTTDSVDIVFAVGGKIVVDDQGDLLDINTTSQQIRGNQHTRRSTSKLLHNDISLRLVHITVHSTDRKVLLCEFIREPIDLSAGIAENDGLGDCDSFVEIGKGIEFPVFLFDGNVELFDTFECEFVFFDEDADGIAHEFLGDFEDVRGHGGGKEDSLGVLGEELEDVVDLVFETALLLEGYMEKRYRKHLVCFVEDKHFDVVCAKGTTVLDHIEDSSRCTNNDVDTFLEDSDIITDNGTANTSVTLQ